LGAGRELIPDCQFYVGRAKLQFTKDFFSLNSQLPPSLNPLSFKI
jgi:hypothetical protein